MKSALEARWNLRIKDEHLVLTWLVEQSAVILNKCGTGHDGRTPHERLKGKKATMITIEFGVRVHHRKKPKIGPLAKLEVLWQDGVYLGQRAVSGECIVGFGSGVETTRNVHRKPEGERWTPDSERLVQGVPWRTSPDDPEQDGLVEVLPPRLDLEEGSALASESVPRRLYLKKEDFEPPTGHGYSAKCPGCRALMSGKPSQNHSEECRN